MTSTLSSGSLGMSVKQSPSKTADSVTRIFSETASIIVRPIHLTWIYRSETQG